MKCNLVKLLSRKNTHTTEVNGPELLRISSGSLCRWLVEAKSEGGIKRWL